jgi:ATP-dependent DNA ligase
LHPQAQVVESIKCEGERHLKKMLDEIISKGGEGVILRHPQLGYGRRRAGNRFLKFKVSLFFIFLI